MKRILTVSEALIALEKYEEATEKFLIALKDSPNNSYIFMNFAVAVLK